MTSNPFSIKTPQFSVYDYGKLNAQGKATPAVKPFRITSLRGVYKYITGTYAKEATEYLRSLSDHAEQQQFKALNFRTISPAGIFGYRNAKSLVQHSGLMVIDIDGITSHRRLMKVREMLLDDPVFETELLFVSPSGHGLKWIIYVGDMQGKSHKEYFGVVRNYLLDTYDIEADKSGSDVCRICYLPYDPNCYINPEFLGNADKQPNY